MPPTTILLWVGLLALAAIGPGPCLIASLRAGLKYGPQAMVETGVGFGLSAFAWTIASFLGLTALLVAHPLACGAITLLGGTAVVLVGIAMLGMLWLRGPRIHDLQPSQGDPTTSSSSRRRFSLRRVTKSAAFHTLSPGTPVFFIAVTPILMADSCSTGAAVSPGTTFALAVASAIIFTTAHSLMSRAIPRLKSALQTPRRLAIFEFSSAIVMVGAGAAIVI